MTSFRVGIISSRRISAGKPRSSKAGSARAPPSDKQVNNRRESDDAALPILNQTKRLRPDGGWKRVTFGTLPQRVGFHAEGGAEAFTVAEASRFGLLGGTLLDGLGVHGDLPARPDRRPCIGKANTLQDAHLLAATEENNVDDEESGTMNTALKTKQLLVHRRDVTISQNLGDKTCTSRHSAKDDGYTWAATTLLKKYYSFFPEDRTNSTKEFKCSRLAALALQRHSPQGDPLPSIGRRLTIFGSVVTGATLVK